MGFIDGNIGYEASQALEQMKEDRRREEAHRARLEGDAFDRRMREADYNERLRENSAREREREDTRKVSHAQLLANVLDSMHDPASGSPTEIDAQQRRTLEGTPYALRVKDEHTLPTRATAPELAGSISEAPQSYSYLRPTAAQQGQRRQIIEGLRKREDFERLRQSPNLPTKVGLMMDLERAGMNAAPIGSELLETDADRNAEDTRAFTNFQRRENYQDALIRGRQPARAPRDAQKERRDAMRAARRDAIAEYNARKDTLSGLPGADLDELIDQYEDDYLSLLDEIEAAEGTASTGPGRSSTVRLAPSHGTPPQNGGRSVVNLRRRDQPSGMPATGEQRVINGQRAQWDGKGWVAIR